MSYTGLETAGIVAWVFISYYLVIYLFLYRFLLEGYLFGAYLGYIDTSKEQTLFEQGKYFEAEESLEAKLETFRYMCFWFTPLFWIVIAVMACDAEIWEEPETAAGKFVHAIRHRRNCNLCKTALENCCNNQTGMGQTSCCNPDGCNTVCCKSEENKQRISCCCCCTACCFQSDQERGVALIDENPGGGSEEWYNKKLRIVNDSQSWRDRY